MKRFKRDEKGSVTVIITLLMVVLVGFSSLVIDYGNLVSHKRQLQNAVDAACLAAAQELPLSTTAAQQKASEYLAVNAPGAVLQSVVFLDNNKRVTVTASWDVEYYMARAITSDESKVITAWATALVTNALGPFNYALFSASDIDLLQFTGQNYISGDVHSNYNVKNSATVDGTVTAVGIIDGKITATHKVPGYNVLPMPDFSNVVDAATVLDYATMISYGATYKQTTYTMAPDELNALVAAYTDKTVYIDGSLTIDGSGICATGCIIVSGDITFNGSGVEMSATDGMCLASLNGDIEFNGANGVFRGILYSPTGEVNFNGQIGAVYGCVFAGTIRGNGGLNIYYDSSVKDSIPDTEIVLVG